MVGIGEGDAIEGEVWGDGMDEFPALEEGIGVAAGGDDIGPEAEGSGVVFDEFFDHAADAVVDAVEEGLFGVLAEGGGRDGEFDEREFGGSLLEGLEHGGSARGDGTAEEFAAVVAAIDGDGGAGIDDDAGFLHLFVGGGDIEDAVDAGLVWLFGEDFDGQVDVFADPLGGPARLFFDGMFEELIEGGVDAGGGDGGVGPVLDVGESVGDFAGPIIAVFN